MSRQLKFSNEQVLERAMLTFWANGYRATSPQMLAHHLEISVSSVYNKYGKDGLFLAGINKYIQEIVFLIYNDDLANTKYDGQPQYVSQFVTR